MTECTQESFAFADHFSRRVVASFDGAYMTSDGGSLLLRRTERKSLLRNSITTETCDRKWFRGRVSLGDMAYLTGEARQQGTMFPVTLDELIPADHVCRDRVRRPGSRMQAEWLRNPGRCRGSPSPRGSSEGSTRRRGKHRSRRNGNPGQLPPTNLDANKDQSVRLSLQRFCTQTTPGTTGLGKSCNSSVTGIPCLPQL